jgi:hypothetical protein
MSNFSSNKETLRQQINTFIKENPIKYRERGCYNQCAERFGLTAEQVRRIYRTLKSRDVNFCHVEGTEIPKTTLTTASNTNSFKENVKTGEADLITVTNKRIKTLGDLIAICEIDLEVWDIVSWECNKWEVGAKNAAKEIVVSPLFQVKAKLSRRKIDTDLRLQKEALLEELKGFKPNYDLDVINRIHTGILRPDNQRLLEICIFDPHFGKLSWREEAGEDYDIKIAEKRVKDAIKDLLSEVNLSTVERILLPLGNDLINVDSSNNMTFAGTPQSTDVRYPKIIKVVRRVLTQIILDLSLIAPVDVVIVPGNHDTISSFMMGEILDATFSSNPRVNVDNGPKLRKYYRYGLNSFQFSHGNEERHEALGLIFATEEKNLWAATKFRFSQLGHYHKNKKINYVSVDEHQGFQIQILPSLSGVDAWHYKKGYKSLHQAKALLYDKDKGPVGEFTTTSTL